MVPDVGPLHSDGAGGDSGPGLIAVAGATADGRIDMVALRGLCTHVSDSTGSRNTHARSKLCSGRVY